MSKEDFARIRQELEGELASAAAPAAAEPKKKKDKRKAGALSFDKTTSRRKIRPRRRPRRP